MCICISTVVCMRLLCFRVICAIHDDYDPLSVGILHEDDGKFMCTILKAENKVSGFVHLSNETENYHRFYSRANLVCVCVFVCVYVLACMHAHAYVCLWVCMCVGVHVPHVCTWIHARRDSVCARACMCKKKRAKRARTNILFSPHFLLLFRNKYRG